MAWFRNLFSVLVEAAGIPVYQRTTHNHYGPGAPTVTDNPGQDRTDYYYSGAPISGALPSPVTVGNWTFTVPTPSNTSDGSTASLLATAITVPASGTLRLRGTVEAKLLSYAHTWVSTWTFAAKWRRNGTSTPTIDFAGLISDESNINGPPFADVGGNPTSTMSFSAVASDSGAAKLTVASTSGLSSGCSGTVSGSSVPGYNGTWALTVDDATHVTLRGSTYSSTATGTLTIGGSVSPNLVGNAGQLQASGILPPAWISGESVTAGAVRYASGSGQTYIYTSNGTTSANPTGTTTGSDSGLTYEWVAAGQFCPITWSTFLESTTT